MEILTSEELISRGNEYNENSLSNDLQSMLDEYNKLSKLDIEKIRKEVDEWDFKIDKDETDMDIISATYVRFTEYNQRIVNLTDKVDIHNEILDFIIKSVKDISAGLTKGTAKEKDSKSSIILLPLSLEFTKIKSLLNYLKSTKESIQFTSNQLARILREKEVANKTNPSFYKSGQSSIYQEKEVKIRTKN